MFKEIMKKCCGSDGNPDFDEMVKFMTHYDRASKYVSAQTATSCNSGWDHGNRHSVGLEKS